MWSKRLPVDTFLTHKHTHTPWVLLHTLLHTHFKRLPIGTFLLHTHTPMGTFTHTLSHTHILRGSL